MNARIEIVTRTLGKTSRFCAVGKSERREEGAVVTYPTEGDIATLELSGFRAAIARRGNICYDAEFRVGASSVFRMSLDGSEAELPIVTYVYKCFFRGSDVFARLSYDLQTGQTFQKFSLKIHIQVISEES